MAEVQITIASLTLLANIGLSQTSALKVFQGFIGWFFCNQPISAYCYILLGVVFEGKETAHRLRRLNQYLWSKLPRKAQKLFVLKHYILFPSIFVGCSYGVTWIIDGYLTFIPGLAGLVFCYGIMMFTL